MIRLLSVLLFLSNAAAQTVVETELFSIRFDATVSPAQRIATVKAVTHLGWLCDRVFPSDVPEPWPRGKAVMLVYSHSGLGWSIAETSVNGPGWLVNGWPLPLRPILTWNADNWNPLSDAFVYGDQTAYEVAFHEGLHALGVCVMGAISNGITPPVSNESAWWGPEALAAYNREVDPGAGLIPLADQWHTLNAAAPFAITTNVLESRLGYNPQLLYDFELGYLRDIGIPTVRLPQPYSLSELYNRRVSPWAIQPVILTSP